MYPVTITLPAGESLSGWVGKTVKVSSHTFLKSTADYDAIGVLVSDGASGAPVAAVMYGPCKAYLGEAAVEGDILHSESDGVFELYDDTGDTRAAICLQAGADGDLVDIMFLGNGDGTVPHA